jgi:hypothetical protein
MAGARIAWFWFWLVFGPRRCSIRRMVYWGCGVRVPTDVILVQSGATRLGCGIPTRGV